MNYLVRVREIHEGYIRVTAKSESEAMEKAEDVMETHTLMDCGTDVSVENEVVEVEEDYGSWGDDDDE